MDRSLASLGWDADLTSVPDNNTALGRIVAQDRGAYLADVGSGPRRAACAGRLLHLADGQWELPVVGDWVLLRHADETLAVIDRVLPRRTELSRNVGREFQDDRGRGRSIRRQVLVANVDLVWIVTAMSDEFDVGRLERYLAMVRTGGADAGILLNKADLDSSAADRASELAEEFRVPVLATSGLDGTGLTDLGSKLMPGHTNVFVGSSGVGKSTLLNELLAQDAATTRPTRDDDRGRHTTTRRQMWTLPSGALVIDTPGLRELGMLADTDLTGPFGDIIELVESCRFNDCKHGPEPGCAITAALDSGELDPRRWASYVKLEKEKVRVRMRSDPRAAAERKAHWKAMTKQLRAKDEGWRD